MAEDEFDVEALLEAPYVNGVSWYFIESVLISVFTQSAISQWDNIINEI